MILGRFSEVAATRRYSCIKKFDREDWMVSLLGGADLGGLPVLLLQYQFIFIFEHNNFWYRIVIVSTAISEKESS